MAGKKPENIGSQKARNTAARLVAVQSVYDMAITGNLADIVLAGYRDHRYGQAVEGIDYIPADLDLLAKIVRGVDGRKADLVEMIQGAMANNRASTAQPEALLRALLMCGAYEILAHGEIDAPIIISEYMTIAEGFFEGGEPKLVNAVLDRLNKIIRV